LRSCARATSRSSTPGCWPSDEDGDRASATLREPARRPSSSRRRWRRRPSYTVTALAALDAPVGDLETRSRSTRLPDGLTQAQATVNSSQVAAVMLAKPLVAPGAAFATVTAAPADAVGMETLTRTVRAAARPSALARRLGAAGRLLDPGLPRRRVDFGELARSA
jgi:hypothetical protein